MDFSTPLRFDVDSPRDAGPKLEYLAAFAELEATKRYKNRSFELLGLSSGERLLEVGCGSGADLTAASRQVAPNGLVYGVDTDATMLEGAERVAANTAAPVHLALGSASLLPFPNGSFDACRADRLLQHLKEPQAAVAEMVRTVRTGGRLVLCDADWGTLTVQPGDRQVTRAILDWFCDSIPSGWAGRQLGCWLNSNGCQVDSIEPYTLCFRDLDQAHQALGLQQAALSAAEAGAVDLETVADWLMELDASRADGRFLASITGFAALGVKSLRRLPSSSRGDECKG